MSADNVFQNRNIDGLSPVIVISDLDNAERFRFESDQVVPAANQPVQDFKLNELTIHAGINSDHGYCTVGIDDRNNTLLDSSKRRSIRIKNGWKLEVWLGKGPNSLYKWFTGIIAEPELTRPTATLQNIGLTAFGYGIRTAHRIGNIQRSQKRLIDGINPDNTDTKTKISELFKAMLTNPNFYAHPGLGSESEITTNNVRDIDIKLLEYNKKYQTLAVILNDLAQSAGAIYGIDPNLDAFLRIRGSESSGFLVTNDTENPGLATRNWGSGRIMFIRNRSFNFKDSTIEAGYTVAHGVGAQHDIISHDFPDANATFWLSWNLLGQSGHAPRRTAIPFITTHEVISKISLFLARRYNDNTEINHPLQVHIVGSDADGNPNLEDQRFVTSISHLTLDDELGTQGKFINIQFEKNILSVSRGEKLFIYLWQLSDYIAGQEYPTTEFSGFLTLDYQTQMGRLFYTDDEGQTWQQATGQPKFKIYYSKTMRIIGQNTTARRCLKEKETILSLQDFPNEHTALAAFEGMLDSLGKVKRIYDPITVTAPTLRPEIGKTVRLIDKFNGLDVEVDLIGYDIAISAFDPLTNRGATTMKLYLEEWFN